MKTQVRKSIHNLMPTTGIDLTGKRVKLRDSFFRADLRHRADELTFTCEGGFGCSPSAMGRAVFGRFSDGENARIDRGDIEGIVIE